MQHRQAKTLHPQQSNKEGYLWFLVNKSQYTSIKNHAIFHKTPLLRVAPFLLQHSNFPPQKLANLMNQVEFADKIQNPLELLRRPFQEIRKMEGFLVLTSCLISTDPEVIFQTH